MEEKERKEKSIKAGEALKEDLAKMLHEKLGIPVFLADSKKVESVFECVKKIPNIENKFTESELREEVNSFLFKISILDKPKNRIELEKRIKKFVEELEKEKVYEAYLLLRDLIGLPIGLKIGPLEIVNEVKNKKKLLNHIDYLRKKSLVYTEGRSWGYVKFKSYKIQRVSEYLYDLLELPFGILSLIMGMDLDVRDACGLIYSEIGHIYYLMPKSQPRGWARYLDKAHKRDFDLLTKVTHKAKRNTLEDKIIQSIKLYWLSRMSEKIETRFLLTISSLESLLLTKNDRDYIGLKLSEKTTFLLEDNIDKRISLFKRMKKYYEKRSRLIHSGKSDINRTDERTIASIYRVLVFKLLELGQKYKKMEQKSHSRDQEGIEDYINGMKFA